MVKLMEFFTRIHIFLIGFRQTYIPGVWAALQRRGVDITKAKVYKRNLLVMILYKNKTVVFDTYHWVMEKGFFYDKTAEEFIDYVYEQLESENWE